jgi:hypothetical protein
MDRNFFACFVFFVVNQTSLSNNANHQKTG